MEAAISTTTLEEDRSSLGVRTEAGLRTAGQRRINIIWEVTQATIALAVTGATLYVAAMLALKDQGQTAAFLLLSNAFFLVVGFYFGRTNHQRVGGIGSGPTGDTR
jgi:hypothetical protein